MATIKDVEQAKANGRYRYAGQLQALLGLNCNYGCHYGMRSSKDLAVALFGVGWDEVNFWITET